MKTITKLCAAIFLLSSCTSMKQTAGTYNDDDIYASSKDQHAVNPPVQNNTPAPAPQQNVTNPEQVRVFDGNNSQSNGNYSENPNSTEVQKDANGNTYITNKYYDNNFDYDDYYDYEYATR